MKHNIVADTSFYSCNIKDLSRLDLITYYLENYQFHAGHIILDKELLPNIDCDKTIADKISRRESANYTELFKALCLRDDKHIEEDGEYEAIGIALELALTNELHRLIIDDSTPRNFAKKIPLLKEKTMGTIGFIRDSYHKDRIITKEQCIAHLKAIHRAYETNPDKNHRPCSMDEKIVKNVLLPLIQELENA